MTATAAHRPSIAESHDLSHAGAASVDGTEFHWADFHWMSLEPAERLLIAGLLRAAPDFAPALHIESVIAMLEESATDDARQGHRALPLTLSSRQNGAILDHLAQLQRAWGARGDDYAPAGRRLAQVAEGFLDRLKAGRASLTGHVQTQGLLKHVASLFLALKGDLTPGESIPVAVAIDRTAADWAAFNLNPKIVEGLLASLVTIPVATREPVPVEFPAPGMPRLEPARAIAVLGGDEAAGAEDAAITDPNPAPTALEEPALPAVFDFDAFEAGTAPQQFAVLVFDAVLNAHRADAETTGGLTAATILAGEATGFEAVALYPAHARWAADSAVHVAEAIGRLVADAADDRDRLLAGLKTLIDAYPGLRKRDSVKGLIRDRLAPGRPVSQLLREAS
jgi:hypothetical protein